MKNLLMGVNYFEGKLVFEGDLQCKRLISSELGGLKIFFRKGDHGQRLS